MAAPAGNVPEIGYRLKIQNFLSDNYEKISSAIANSRGAILLNQHTPIGKMSTFTKVYLLRFATHSSLIQNWDNAKKEQKKLEDEINGKDLKIQELNAIPHINDNTEIENAKNAVREKTDAIQGKKDEITQLQNEIENKKRLIESNKKNIRLLERNDLPAAKKAREKTIAVMHANGMKGIDSTQTTKTLLQQQQAEIERLNTALETYQAANAQNETEIRSHSEEINTKNREILQLVQEQRQLPGLALLESFRKKEELTAEKTKLEARKAALDPTIEPAKNRAFLPDAQKETLKGEVKTYLLSRKNLESRHLVAIRAILEPGAAPLPNGFDSLAALDEDLKEKLKQYSIPELIAVLSIIDELSLDHRNLHLEMSEIHHLEKLVLEELSGYKAAEAAAYFEKALSVLAVGSQEAIKIQAQYESFQKRYPKNPFDFLKPCFTVSNAFKLAGAFMGWYLSSFTGAIVTYGAIGVAEKNLFGAKASKDPLFTSLPPAHGSMRQLIPIEWTEPQPLVAVAPVAAITDRERYGLRVTTAEHTVPFSALFAFFQIPELERKLKAVIETHLHESVLGALEKKVAGKKEEVRQIASQTIAIFRSQSVSRLTLSKLSFLMSYLEEEGVVLPKEAKKLLNALQLYFLLLKQNHGKLEEADLKHLEQILQRSAPKLFPQSSSSLVAKALHLSRERAPWNAKNVLLGLCQALEIPVNPDRPSRDSLYVGSKKLTPKKNVMNSKFHLPDVDGHKVIGVINQSHPNQPSYATCALGGGAIDVRVVDPGSRTPGLIESENELFSDFNNSEQCLLLRPSNFSLFP